MTRLLTPLSLGMFLATAGVSLGSLVGLSTDPMGPGWERGDSNSAFGVWSTFPSFSFTGDAPDTGAGFLTIGLGQSTALSASAGANQGANLFDFVGTPSVTGNQIMYTGGRPPSFSLEGTLAFDAHGFTLQIKTVGSGSGLGTTVFPTLNGLAPDFYFLTAGTGDTATTNGGAYAVTTWHWGNNLAGQSITNFTIAIPMPNNFHTAIDEIALDAGPSAVPEPSAALLLLTGAAIGISRRRPATR